MSILEARNITKVFPGVTALDGVSLEIGSGTIHCVIGENGAGKSTLIKILTGIQSADEGEIIIDGAIVERGDLNRKKNKKIFENIAYAPQELDLFNDLSVAENLFMPFKANGIKGVINKNSLGKMAIPWLERFKMSVGPGELVKNISVSERQMLQIARSMTNSNARILMLDEPTTSLTASEAGHLFTVLKELKSQGKAIIFISHKLEEIFEIGDKITVLRNGQKTADAAVSEVDIPWVISAMVGSEVNQDESYKSEKISDEVLMTVKGLTGEKFSDIDFSLRQGEILGFSGLVGSGRTEIMQALFGYLPVWAGEAFIEGKPWRFGKTDFSVRNGFTYLPEDRKQHGILPKLSVKQNIIIALLDQVKNAFLIVGKKENALAENVINAYNIKVSSAQQLIQNLSGGNQQKAIIGRSMFARPKIMVFDEPTKGIDIGSKVEIYKLMKRLAEEERIGIILISSEMNEVLKCSNRIITIYFGNKVGESSAPFNKTDILNEIMGVKKSQTTRRTKRE